MKEAPCCEACVAATGVRCMVGRGVPVTLLDLCPHGIRVELRTPLRPAVPSLVVLTAAGGELRLNARVQWCQVMSDARVHGTSHGLRYHARLEFSSLDSDDRAALDRLLASLAPRQDPPHAREDIA